MGRDEERLGSRKAKLMQLRGFPHPVWEGDSRADHTSRGMVKTGLA